MHGIDRKPSDFDVNCYEYFNLLVIISTEVFLSLFFTTENYGQL